ncbi:MAG TPA: hypothetical protein VF334_09555 [Polyangia bacterium]
MDAELHFADETHAIGSVGPVFINVVRKPATLEMLKETRRQVQRHFRRCNNVSLALSVLEPGAAQAVPREVRDEGAALTAEFKSLAAATVIEGTGFRAAATRTAIAGMYFISKPPYPHKVFSDLSEGAGWVIATGSRTTPIGATSEEIVRAVELVRRALRNP